ncbi:hypothetical protein ABGB18_16320 [Nonomuraea sp. B12E4]|uniref:hypothetical protein n=1 Tax=Nonomuraea sp. B12E4 TaxID=3153564 RepID=UPI00325C72BC
MTFDEMSGFANKSIRRPTSPTRIGLPSHRPACSGAASAGVGVVAITKALAIAAVSFFMVSPVCDCQAAVAWRQVDMWDGEIEAARAVGWR